MFAEFSEDFELPVKKFLAKPLLYCFGIVAIFKELALHDLTTSLAIT